MEVFMNKIRLYAAGFILVALAVVCIACNSPNGPGSSTTYTVTFDSNHHQRDTTKYADASPATKSVTSPATTIDSLPTPPTLEGSTFISWNTKDDGSGTAFTATTPVPNSITVYAQWDPEGTVYTVHININPTGKEGSDNVTVVPVTGQDGENVTISYTLSTGKLNNQLAF
jgi:uncharacterized repeat protein (TIGR02543 family)